MPFAFGAVSSSLKQTRPVVIVGTLFSPFVWAYKWSSGFGTKYANPIGLPNNSTKSVAFQSNGGFVALGGSGSLWSWGDGFGPKYGSNFVTTTQSNRNAFNRNGTYAYWVQGIGVTTQYYYLGITGSVAANGSTAQLVSVSFYTGISFSQSGNTMTLTASGNMPIGAFPFSGTNTTGTRYQAPNPTSNQASYNPKFRNSNDYIMTACDASPHFYIFPFTEGTGWGTRLAAPATLPSGTNGISVAWSTSGNDIFIQTNGNPNCNAYAFSTSTGIGTKYADPASYGSSVAQSDIDGVNYSEFSNDVFFISVASPYIYAFPWVSGTGFGTKYADPATLPDSQGYSVATTK